MPPSRSASKRFPARTREGRPPVVTAPARAHVVWIRAGIATARAERLAAELGLPKAEVFRLLGVSARTIPRRIEAGVLTPIESDRLYRLERVLALAEDAIGERQKARCWITRPNVCLGGVRPFDQLDTEAGTREVENLLEQIKHGIPA